MNRILLPLAFSAIAAAFVLAMISAQGRTNRPSTDVADIGVEHASSAKLIITLSMGKRPGILEISSENKELVHVSVPRAWERREVRNALLADVTADAPSLGFTRWKLPPGAVLSLILTHSPAGLIIHHPTRQPLSIRLTRINMITGAVQTDVFLLEEEMLRLF